MQEKQFKNGLISGRLSSNDYADNFSDIHPALSDHEALVAADRCYFCYDAPCTTACPTDIDIPLFIREISTKNPLGAAKTIFDQNILGGMCARVCPTETLCEQACVREIAEGKPVKIGLLQRYATDTAMAAEKQFYKRAKATGRSVAVIGAGPAGLACAHRLAIHGHEVTVFDANKKSGGLNEYGIASYKTVDDFAQIEVDYIQSVGGITIKNNKRLGKDFDLAGLCKKYDAVFLGMGLSGVNDLGIKSKKADGLEDAVDFIKRLRQVKSLRKIPVGRNVIVIGGGMTAIDAAIQAKLLGAEQVTICYRRGQEHMNASIYEQELATAKGVTIRHWLQPSKVHTNKGAVSAMTMEYTHMKKGKLSSTGNTIKIPADHILSAIGQSFKAKDLTKGDCNIALKNGRIKVNKHYRTTHKKIWAGGDCIYGGDDLTVAAVAHGRDAAENIHQTLTQNKLG